MASGRRPSKLASEELFEYAVKCLGARAYSTADLKWKLRLRAANPADAEAAIDRLREIGYLDDKSFAESYAAARIENEGFGRMRVLRDLRAKRVDSELADRAVTQAIGDRSEDELIEAFIARRISSLRTASPIQDDRQLAAAYRKLQRAGFTSGAILRALKRLAARPEELEEPSEDPD